MLSLTWQSLVSSATSSATVDSSMTVSRQLDAAAAAHDVGRVMAGTEERRCCPWPCTRDSEGLRDWYGVVRPEDMEEEEEG